MENLLKRSKLTKQIDELRKKMSSSNSGDVEVIPNIGGNGGKVESRQLASHASAHYILIKGLKKDNSSDHQLNNVGDSFHDNVECDSVQDTQKRKSAAKVEVVDLITVDAAKGKEECITPETVDLTVSQQSGVETVDLTDDESVQLEAKYSGSGGFIVDDEPQEVSPKKDFYKTSEHSNSSIQEIENEHICLVTETGDENKSRQSGNGSMKIEFEKTTASMFHQDSHLQKMKAAQSKTEEIIISEVKRTEIGNDKLSNVSAEVPNVVEDLQKESLTHTVVSENRSQSKDTSEGM